MRVAEIYSLYDSPTRNNIVYSYQDERNKEYKVPGAFGLWPFKVCHSIIKERTDEAGQDKPEIWSLRGWKAVGEEQDEFDSWIEPVNGRFSLDVNKSDEHNLIASIKEQDGESWPSILP